MSDFRVASRYAKSLLELSEEQGALEEVHSDMMLFNSICESNRDFVLMLRNPIVTHQMKLEVLTRIFEKRIHSLTMSIFTIITRKNRESILPSIAKSFHHQYNVVKGITQAEVTTVTPLDDELREEFIKSVKEITGNEVELIENTEDDIIGGYRLKIGDQQIDDTIKSKIDLLKLSFKQNPYLKDF